MKVCDESNFEFFSNFLRINFYFDKDVLLYLDSIDQNKVSKSVSK